MTYPDPMSEDYVLDDQIGYVLRRVTQRHLALFAQAIPDVTTTQMAVLARLAQLGPQSQNALGRETAMDAATIKGVVSFSGKAPEMKVPAKRKDADFCKTKEVKYNAVLVKDGKLQDVLVRIAAGGVPGTWKAPEKHAEIDQADCMYTPRIQGVVAGQEIDIKNADSTLHNVHTFKGNETWFNQA